MGKSTGEKLSKDIGMIKKLPDRIDKYVAEQPHLIHNESFMIACLTLKDFVRDFRVMLTTLQDTVSLYDKKQSQGEEWEMTKE